MVVLMMQQLLQQIFLASSILYMLPLCYHEWMHACMEAHCSISCAANVWVQHFLFYTCLKLPEETTSSIYKALFEKNLKPEFTGYLIIGFSWKNAVILKNIKASINLVIKTSISKVLYTHYSGYCYSSNKFQVMFICFNECHFSKYPLQEVWWNKTIGSLNSKYHSM